MPPEMKWSHENGTHEEPAPTPPPAPRTPRRTPPRHPVPHPPPAARQRPSTPRWRPTPAAPSPSSPAPPGPASPPPATRCSRWRRPAPPPAPRAAGPASPTPGPSPARARRHRPGGSPEAGQAGQPGDDPAGSPDGAGEDETAGERTGARTARARGPRDAEAGTGAAQTAEPGPRRRRRRRRPRGAVPGEQDDEAAPGSDPDGGDAPRDEDAPADTGGEAGDAPDPALVTDLTERLDQIKAAADAAELVLTAGGDLRAALAGLDEIDEQAAQARRSLKAAIGGRKAPAVRPGGLRDKVLAHLGAHPGAEFTPHEIHKVLGHSSGAIANALDTLVKLGDAEVATEKPRRFRRAAQPADAAPGRRPAADGAEQDGTELAGAA